MELIVDIANINTLEYYCPIVTCAHVAQGPKEEQLRGNLLLVSGEFTAAIYNQMHNNFETIASASNDKIYLNVIF